MPITPRPGGGGGATIPATTDLIAGDGAGNGADSLIAPASVMLKSVYDPLNAGKISGGGSGTGGILSMEGPGGSGGSIKTDGGGSSAGGSIDLSAFSNPGGGPGGSLLLMSLGGGSAGSINTSTNGEVNGGSINTSNGGGNIDTTGTGLIELGGGTTKTSLTGTASAARSIALPDNGGTVALISDLPSVPTANVLKGAGGVLTAAVPGTDYLAALGATDAIQKGNSMGSLVDATDSGWVANGDVGDKTAVIPSEAAVATIITAANLAVSGLGDWLDAVADKVKAIETALAANLIPNA